MPLSIWDAWVWVCSLSVQDLIMTSCHLRPRGMEYGAQLLRGKLLRGLVWRRYGGEGAMCSRPASCDLHESSRLDCCIASIVWN